MGQKNLMPFSHTSRRRIEKKQEVKTQDDKR